jgi:hypothetical protein
MSFERFSQGKVINSPSKVSYKYVHVYKIKVRK